MNHPTSCPSDQEHLVQFWPQLNDGQRSRLTKQVAKIDFGQIKRLHADSQMSIASFPTGGSLDAPRRLISASIENEDPSEVARARKLGWQALSDGRVAVLLVAGGEGSRLGFPHPKGQFPIAPVSGKTLFQLLAEQVLAVSGRAAANIPYYVMTSDATHDETEDFFKAHSYFGLDAALIRFFRQGSMPAVDRESGRVLMTGLDSVAFSPDGHGGVIDAMRNNSIFDDLRGRKIDILFYHQVDNPLVKVCDPAFIGFHLSHGSEASTKVVAKEDPSEKVGLLVDVDGKHHIIEYSDLSKDLAEQRDEDGKLKLRCGNIAVHLFDTAFLERMSTTSLPYHKSVKAVPFINADGEFVEPKDLNAFKFEKFIFDILPYAHRPLAMEVAREEEFVPLKNRCGIFSPEHVQKAMRQLHTSWLRQAGWTNEEELPIEIPAAVALSHLDFQSVCNGTTTPPTVPE